MFQLVDRICFHIFLAFYAFSIGVFLAPGDFPSYVEFIKNLEISPALLFPAKTIVAFPLVYHYINGIRHLVSLLFNLVFKLHSAA